MPLSPDELDALAQLSTPTVANAIELFNIRPRNEGYMTPAIRCLFPDLGVMAGYAVTARFAADQPAKRPAPRLDFWNYLLQIPEPRVLVFEDLDNPPGAGAYFGEVQATVHRRLGCRGVVTNGHVRDLDEVAPLGFHFFAGGVCVSHAYVHLVDFGSPVKVGGLSVQPGAVVHADKHGVLLVPAEIAAQIPQAAQRVAERERRILEHCRAEDFSLARLNGFFEADY